MAAMMVSWKVVLWAVSTAVSKVDSKDVEKADQKAASMVEMSAALLAFESVATKAVGLVVLSEKR